MRHAAAFCNQFPVTAHIASLILYNPSATADIQEKLLATNREILNYSRLLIWVGVQRSKKSRIGVTPATC